jgi:XTP/dITP diphosphohydrolase
MTLPLPLIIATQNADKATEIVEIFAAFSGEPLAAYAIEEAGYVLDTPERIAATVEVLPVLAEAPAVAETGSTLEENARIKAGALADAFGMLAVADDTGLEVDALNGAPGVYSARYAGEDATYDDNVRKLMHALDDTPDTERTARFATVAMARTADGLETSVRGEVEGVIARRPRGAGGFGYDPVFVPAELDGRTFAEMSSDEKHSVSHRGRAFRALAAALAEQE